MSRRKYKSFSLRKKILLYLNILIVLSLLTVALVTYKLSSRIILEDSIRHTQDILSLVFSRCQDILTGAQRSMDQVFYNTRIMGHLDSLSKLEKGEKRQKLINEVKVELQSTVIASEDITAYSISLEDEIITFSEHDNMDKTFEVQQYAMKSIVHKGRGETVYFKMQDKGTHIASARAVYTNNFNKPDKVFYVLIPLERFKKSFKTLLKENYKYFTLVDDNSYEELVTYEKVRFDKNSFIQYIKGQDVKKSAVYEDNKLNILVSYQDFSNPDWWAFLIIPQEILYARLNQLSLIQLIVAISVLLIASIIASLLAQDIVRPLQLLVYRLKEFETTPSKMNLPLNRNDEIGYLYETMNKMSERLDHLINMVYREQINRKDAELKALQAQINPHFLFNTLETISWKSRLEGAEIASNMITALSHMLHVNIGREGRDFISIGEEIEYLNNFFYLQKIRHEDLIEFSSNVAPEIMPLEIPSLSLQPIAENAIFHNTPINELLIIKLTGFCRSDKIIIELSDSGSGISDEKRALISKALEQSDSYIVTDVKRNRKSVGLVNVNRRIKLFYGEEYGLSIGKSNTGALITMTLPLKPKPRKGTDDVPSSNN